MHRAEQRFGVAVALEKGAARPDRVRRIDIGSSEELRIARLQRRMDEIAGEHRGIAPAPPWMLIAYMARASTEWSLVTSSAFRASMIGSTLSSIAEIGVLRWTPSQYSYSFFENT